MSIKSGRREVNDIVTFKILLLLMRHVCFRLINFHRRITFMRIRQEDGSGVGGIEGGKIW